MYNRHWDVLVVDEPGGAAEQRRALEQLTVYGLPLRLHEATSPVEALDVLLSLSTSSEGGGQLAVVLCDAEIAGEGRGPGLCRLVREELHNRTTQLCLHAGPEILAACLALADRYDVAACVTSAELTLDRLHLMVGAAIRRSYLTRLSRACTGAVAALIEAADSRPRLREVLEEQSARALGESRLGALDLRFTWMAEGQVIAGRWPQDPDEVLRRCARLGQGRRQALGGDVHMVLEGDELLLQTDAGPETSAMALLSQVTMPPPEVGLYLLRGYLRAVAMLWHRAPRLARLPQAGDIEV